VRCCAISAISTRRRKAFQDACLRALKNWPQNGPPRDPDGLADPGRPQRRPRRGAQAPPSRRRRRRKTRSPTWTTPRALAERLDGAHYRDDVLRLLFICCHPDLPATQQIAVALRIVSGLTVKQIARAFLVGESGHGAAHHPRQGQGRGRRRAVRDAPARSSGPSGSPPSAMVYLVFNEGYSAAARRRPARRCATRPSGWRGCCCACSPAEPEIMGLTALLLLQHARAAGPPRRRRRGSCCWRTRTAACGTAR
jgi:RNA polymerase sigma-70 factor (ECF subfamily)